MRHHFSIALLLSLSTALPLAASAEQGPSKRPNRATYTVVDGDTCASIAERLYGSSTHWRTVHDYNPHASRTPASCDADLRPGTVLRLPLAPPSAVVADAEVAAVLRKVRSRPPAQTDWGQATRGQDLFAGWRVKTFVSSSADLEFQDSSELHLREETLVIIFGPGSKHARRPISKARLERGTLRTRIAELKGIQVDTPSARASLGTGSALVSVDPEATSRVANHSGATAKVRGKRGGAVKVRSGMGTKVLKGKAPSRPRPLPAAPTWAQGEPALFLAAPGQGATISGAWTAVEQASHYRVEVALQEDGRGPVGATGVAASVRRFELRQVPVGVYHVAVSTIDEDRFESAPSARRAVHVVETTLQSPCSAAPPAADPEAPPPLHAPPLRVLSGSRLALPEGVQCAIVGADVPPARELALDGLGVVELQCTDSASSRQVGAFPIELVTLTATATAPDGQDVSLARGETAQVQVVVDTAGLTLTEEIALRTGPGVSATATRTGAGEYRLTVTVEPGHGPAVTEQVLLVAPLGGGEITLAQLDLDIAASDSARATPVEPDEPAESSPPPPEDEGESEAPRTVHEGGALVTGPFAFGVRDERRRGSGVSISGGYEGVLSGAGERHDGTGALGVRIAVLDDRLRIDGSVPYSLATSEGEGLGFGLSSLIFESERVSVAAGLDLWVPLDREDDQRQPVRLLPSLDLSVSLASDRWRLRTRQGAMLDTADDGAYLWASAYAVDLHLVGPLNIGLEALLLLGGLEGELTAAPALTGAASLHLGLATLSLSVRGGLTDDAEALLGQLQVLASVRIAADL